MEPQEAIKLFETLIVSVMASGGFKDLKTLDDYRKALDTLNQLAKKK